MQRQLQEKLGGWETERSRLRNESRRMRRNIEGERHIGMQRQLQEKLGGRETQCSRLHNDSRGGIEGKRHGMQRQLQEKLDYMDEDLKNTEQEQKDTLYVSLTT